MAPAARRGRRPQALNRAERPPTHPTAHPEDRYLEGEIGADIAAESTYRVFARGKQFLQIGTNFFRRNEVWCALIDRRIGTTVREELIRENVALVKYFPVAVPVVDVVLSS